ncbi:MAG: PrsW family intramembrane metalloprotease [Clostridia bacterium]|nr:PrsW family intramembrane metalloprotease [Clostridia bacterium]
MDNLIYILFICTVAPLVLMLMLLKKRAKLTVGYMLIGIFVSLFVSELNTLLLSLFDGDMLYVTTTITPVTEEIVKAIPVLVFALLFTDDREKLMTIAFAAGIGFAMFENMVILVQNIESVTLGWAVIRGFSTALMHGVCTAAVGYGMSFIRKRRKLFYCGTFALLVMASIYHGIFNMLVQSDYKYFGFVLPAATYVPILMQMYGRNKVKTQKSK